MPVADINDIKIGYEIYGDGDPLILIHGYSYNKSVWVSQINTLSKDFKIIPIDVRGSGESSHPEEAFTMDDLVEDLKGLMDFLKIDRAHLMGWSMGGVIIQNFVLKYPEYADKLILIATHAKALDKAGTNTLRNSIIDIYELRKIDPKKAFFQLSKFMHSTKFRKEMEKNLKKKIHGIITTEELIKDSTQNQCTPLDLKNLTETSRSHNTLDKLSSIKNETLLLAGSKDRLVPVILLEEMHKKMPNSDLKIIQGAGHKLFLEAAPEVNNIIIDFLKT